MEWLAILVLFGIAYELGRIANALTVKTAEPATTSTPRRPMSDETVGGLAIACGVSAIAVVVVAAMRFFGVS